MSLRLWTLLACAGSVLSFSPPATRREVLSHLAVAPLAAFAPAAANAVSAKTGLSSPFTGEYDDPKHPGCLRSVKVVGAKVGPDGRKQRNPTAYVSGVDRLPKGGPNTCTGTPSLDDVWKLEGKVSEDGLSIFIDFGPKGGPRDMLGKYDDFNRPGILCAPSRLEPTTRPARTDARVVRCRVSPRSFPDGNKWTKVSGGTPERRPPAVTLNTGD